MRTTKDNDNNNNKHNNSNTTTKAKKAKEKKEKEKKDKAVSGQKSTTTTTTTPINNRPKTQKLHQHSKTMSYKIIGNYPGRHFSKNTNNTRNQKKTNHWGFEPPKGKRLCEIRGPTPGPPGGRELSQRSGHVWAKQQSYLLTCLLAYLLRHSHREIQKRRIMTLRRMRRLGQKRNKNNKKKQKTSSVCLRNKNIDNDNDKNNINNNNNNNKENKKS